MRFAKMLIFALAVTGLCMSACNSSANKGPAQRARRESRPGRVQARREDAGGGREAPGHGPRRLME
jgi:hypothetical protein